MEPFLTNMDELKQYVIDEGHGVTSLSKLKIKTLPDLFIQPLEKRFDMSKVLAHEFIPVIDISNCEDPKVMESICDAAENHGFFQVVNHGIPLSLIKEVKEAAHKFFDLSFEEKNKHLFDKDIAKNVEYLSSFRPEVNRVLEWRDHLSCLYVSDDEAMELWPSVCSLQRLENKTAFSQQTADVWSTSSVIEVCRGGPQTSVRLQLLEYMKRSESLIKKLLEVLLKRLGIPKVDETNQPFLMGARRISLNYYPVCPNPELAVGIGGHSDFSTLTVLLQDEVGGLYVRKFETNNWVHVPPMKGSLAINIGDALQIMSNGRYKSIEHRVVANGENNRISVPIFVNPRPSDVIGPLPQVIQSGEKVLYKQILYSDYVNHFFSKPYNGKDHIDYAKGM